jgi:hypothetical protein
MTNPIPLPIGGMPNYVNLGYATRPYDDGLALPVSHGTNDWITIPWDTEIYDPPLPGRPNGQHDTNGWTCLFGPAMFWGTAFAMIQGATEGDSIHIMARVAKRIGGVNVIQRTFQASEWFVGPYETHENADGSTYYTNTHVDVPLSGDIGQDERLQIVVDHWNGPAGTDARIVSASVTLHYTPRPWDIVE